MAPVTDRHAWAEPGVEAVGDEVFRIPLPLPGDALRAVNVYAIRAGAAVTLVDAGWNAPASWTALEQGLRRLGRPVAAVRLVAVTHLHHDHVGQAARLREAAGATLLLGQGERPSLEQLLADTDQGRGRLIARLGRLGAGDLAEQLSQGGPEPQERARYELPDLYLADGSQVLAGERRLTVIATPGHTHGHVCLWDEGERTLFAGDHVLPHITPSIGLEPVPARRPLADFLTSLERVRALPAERVLPAHGPVFDDLAGRVDELLHHHQERLDACREALHPVPPGAGGVDAREVAGRIRWTRAARRLHELNWFNQMLAVGETAAHLDVLVDRGLATGTEQDGVVRYRAACSPPSGPDPGPVTERSP
ncbi:MAG TPA: MBL fold metallo-hydrolase [Verrucomicrobiae bacterium]|nr:MBL fold metallo-hydrolase [Verrucomicrobiae bacterium]